MEIRGWVSELRDFGGLRFIILRNENGHSQITLPKKKVSKKVFDIFEEITKESVIYAKGKVQKSDKAMNKEELIPSDIKIISKAEQPVPLDISGKIESGLDARLDWRFLDMRRPEIQAIFRIQSFVVNYFRQHFLEKGFVEIQPPCIISSASEGGANLFPVDYVGKKAYLAQSPQLYKQMAMASGIEKVFMVVPVWRAEKHHTTRHLNESRQCDIEVAFADDDKVLDYLEDFLKSLVKEINKKCRKDLEILNKKIKTPMIHRITYSEAAKKTGTKWGEDFSPEAERKLCEMYKGDVIFIKHYPTEIRSFYSMPRDKKTCFAFDALYNFGEILSGAKRINDAELLKKQIKKKGMKPENFKYYLDAFRYGCPPHSGWSFGLERITMGLLDLENIREASLFPRDVERLVP